MKRLLALGLFLNTLSCWASDIDFGAPDMRHCNGCSAVIKGGYITKVFHPTEGEWRLTPNELVFVDYQLYKVDPEYVYKPKKSKGK